MNGHMSTVEEDRVAEDRHAVALRLYAAGRPGDAMRELTDEVRERLGDADLLNDLGVVAVQAGEHDAGEAVLRTTLLLGPDAQAQANVAALEAMRGNGFIARLMDELVAGGLGPDLPHNFDPLRHPDGPPGPRHAPGIGVPEIARQATALEWLYRNLADDASRRLMVRVFAFRLLGARKVELPIGAPRTRALIDQARSLRIQESTVSLGFLGWDADRYDLGPVGCPLVLDAHPLNIVHTFLLEQYACPEQPAARIAPGDIVIDGGGCWGDTALYFAGRVGPTGRVISYEFSPSNVDLLDANLSRNPDAASRIVVERRALWDRSDERLALNGTGPATQVAVSADGDGVLTRALDDAPQALGLPRIDFIKLDVEGAELRALKGAERILRRDRPRLAIALYHEDADWVEIPAYLHGLGVGYRFSLGHFTIHHEETVLFAWCDEREVAAPAS
jgi:FkbM family methyltransferase